MNNADKAAYPFHYDNSLGSTHEDGLTKREKFAMAAMQGLISNIEQLNGYFNQREAHVREERCEIVAEISCSYADALLNELGKTQ